MAGIQIFQPTAPDFGDANTLLMSGLKGLSSSFDPFAEQINKNQATADTNLMGLLQQAASQYGVGTPEYMTVEENLRAINPNANVNEAVLAKQNDDSQIFAQARTQADLTADSTRAETKNAGLLGQLTGKQIEGAGIENNGSEFKNTVEKLKLHDVAVQNTISQITSIPQHLRTPKQNAQLNELLGMLQATAIDPSLQAWSALGETNRDNTNKNIVAATNAATSMFNAASNNTDSNLGKGGRGSPAETNVNFPQAQTPRSSGQSTTRFLNNVVGKKDYDGKPIQANANRDKYTNSIVNMAKKYNMDPALIMALIHTESDFNPAARSKRGAVGLTQLMPDTAKEMGVQNINDPEQNIEGGIKYFAKLSEMFNGDPRAIAMAYNMGPTGYRTKQPGEESRNHADRVLKRYELYKGDAGQQSNPTQGSPAQGNSDFKTAVKYVNSKATRNQKLSPDLDRALSFMSQMGVTMEVNSGGQPAKGSGGKRVGSTAHDHGHAADGVLKYQGRTLDWNKKEDKAILSKIVEEAAANGINGFGAGYMGKGRFHFGKQNNAASWGGGGTEGSKGFSWVNDAIKSGTARYKANGGAAGADTLTAQASGYSMPSLGTEAPADYLSNAVQMLKDRNTNLSETYDNLSFVTDSLDLDLKTSEAETNRIYDTMDKVTEKIATSNSDKIMARAEQDQAYANAESSLKEQATQANRVDISSFVHPADKETFFNYMRTHQVEPSSFDTMTTEGIYAFLEGWNTFIKEMKTSESAAVRQSSSKLSTSEFLGVIEDDKVNTSKLRDKSLGELTEGNNKYLNYFQEPGESVLSTAKHAFGIGDSNKDIAAAPLVFDAQITQNIERQVRANKNKYTGAFDAEDLKTAKLATRKMFGDWLQKEGGPGAYIEFTQSGRIPKKDKRSAVVKNAKGYMSYADKLNEFSVNAIRAIAEKQAGVAKKMTDKVYNKDEDLVFYTKSSDRLKQLKKSK